MRKLMLLALCGTLTLAAACTKKTEEEPCKQISIAVPSSEAEQLKAFIDSNNIDAKLDSRGFYYKIHQEGEGEKPGECATVNVDYTGRFTNGNQFDGNVNSTFGLGYVVPGFRMGIPLIANGGEISLYLPPTLGYGSNDNGAIPGGSILIFKVKLNSFK